MAQADTNFQQIGTFLTKLEPLAKALEARQGQTPTAGVPTGGLDIMGLLPQLLPMLTGGSGGGALSDEITKSVIDAGLKQMFAGTRLLETIQNKIMTDMGVKVVTEATTLKPSA